MSDVERRRSSRAYLRRFRGTVSDANNAVQLVVGAATVLLGVAAWWRFGPLAGVVVVLVCLLVVAVVAGVRAEGEVVQLQADQGAQPPQPVFVPVMSDADVQRQLLENADQLTALQAASRRRSSWSSMASLDDELAKGPPLFEQLRSAEYRPEGKMNEATVKSRLHQWASVVALLTDDLFPEVPEGFHMPYYGYPPTHAGDPPLSVQRKAEAVIAGYERFHREWAERVTAHYRSLPVNGRPAKYRD